MRNGSPAWTSYHDIFITFTVFQPRLRCLALCHASCVGASLDFASTLGLTQATSGKAQLRCPPSALRELRRAKPAFQPILESRNFRSPKTAVHTKRPAAQTHEPRLRCHAVIHASYAGASPAFQPAFKPCLSTLHSSLPFNLPFNPYNPYNPYNVLAP